MGTESPSESAGATTTRDAGTDQDRWGPTPPPSESAGPTATRDAGTDLDRWGPTPPLPRGEGARTLIYALGGGSGHAARAVAVARRLGGPATVLHQAPFGPPLPRIGGEGWGEGARPLRPGQPPAPDDVVLVRLDPAASAEAVVAWLANALERHDRLVVDTFPGGVAHELPDRLFGRVPATLVARALQRERYPDYDALAERFDAVWLPYPADRCEWDEPPPGDYVGALVRTIALDPGRRVPLLVIGDPTSAPPGWADLLAGASVVDGPFVALPAADRVVALAAGYNLAWELHTAGVRAAYRPLPRRYDDQHRRAALLGVPLAHRADLVAWLCG